MSYFIGVDISKKHLDVCFLKEEDKRFQRFINTAQGIKLLLQELSCKEVSLVVCEPTGGYEEEVCQALREQHYGIHLVNTLAFRDFAPSVHLGKTDRLDSYKLAFYGQKFMLAPKQNFMDKNLKALVQRREDLTRMTGDEKRRLEHAQGDIREDLRQHIDFLDILIQRLNDKIETLVDSQESLKRKAEILRSTPGIGKCLSAKLLGHLPEMGEQTLSLKQLASLVGIAPFSRDSGSKSRHRFIRGGRKIPRDALYMAVLTGRKSIPFLQNVYDRLIAKGKPKKVALVACMRKMLAILHAMLKENREFEILH
ncbi:MAG: transposase [Caedimonas sp.]|nr:transposase [Caedimonas sp.]